ncbi:MAG: sigma-70 family RNA polymerase sigma factor [Bacteroidota bacterium]|nr:sigma-70 family RNA polymerase sigma factor [Bacteroidota bacterium]|tara:strand:+ start:89 stop:676 length:588 start_codon:yes stop_codon:yes gene_type:complete
MLTQTKSDKDLVVNYLKGDNNSFEQLLNRHKNKVFSFIFSKVKNRDLAEDIFQDTFVKVINSLQKGKYNEEGKFLPWMMRISHNLVIDYFRKSNKVKNIRSTDDFNIFDILNNGAKSQEEEMIRKRIYSDLNLLIDLLPIEQRDVIKYRYFEDKSFKEIAELTNVSINTALGRMRYALINLRTISEERKIDLSHR